MKLGIDAGNYRVKICGELGLLDFNSAIGEYREINLKQKHGEDDMIFEYEGEKGFAGSLAEYESEFSGSIMGTSKAHKDTKLRVLLGIHRYLTFYNINESEFKIIVGQPISKHNQEEKDRIKNSIIGEHTITVNNITKSFHIKRVEVAAEGATTIWSFQQRGLVRILDIGSGTVNFATIIDGRYVDKDSDTLPFGMNTNKSKSLQSLARGIATNVLEKWDSNDKVFVVGGAAETILPHMKEYLNDVHILHPIYNNQFTHSTYANAVAFYNVAVNVYE